MEQNYVTFSSADSIGELYPNGLPNKLTDTHTFLS